MHPVRKQRLILVAFIVALSSAAVGLVLASLSENLNLFYPPSQIVSGEAPVGATIRAGGCVVPGTVNRQNDSLEVLFDVTDGNEQLTVSYEGLLPDLFAEGEAVVVTGQLQESGIFSASKVLAKHDETYTPPEVADTVQSEQKEGEDHAEACKGISYDS